MPRDFRNIINGAYYASRDSEDGPWTDHWMDATGHGTTQYWLPDQEPPTGDLPRNPWPRYHEGHQTGRRDGFVVGSREGLMGGHWDGWRDGYDDGAFEGQGYDFGYHHGYFDGEMEGYGDGYEDYGYDDMYGGYGDYEDMYGGNGRYRYY
ncbi:uncharacterized protein K460DRAFT_404656 [Cucurbitaria berberidis CBS 394.84]|uniref:Uncharacterized protein n=1 Tax=Cucurbitaria berberidis CBS 394.84 TaxID=1168544 RepID=A0A9P4GQI1_9PLEO|nr:uncharacterized protein K460DRAFT_404656 [Cucurbitaria berberidis CBS 394.84]KAF1849430.1 hypothetical protein K460DRAFT_404656 [Cucurbitaria berberidis CBS 394.84]